ncbi:hypothetical protein AFB00_00320 [Pseudonocardia sp. HH130630-07]|nr:hypothetical protein AFB00_00320 [Pseudonocardia sp. HH130630-07]
MAGTGTGKDSAGQTPVAAVVPGHMLPRWGHQPRLSMTTPPVTGPAENVTVGDIDDVSVPVRVTIPWVFRQFARADLTRGRTAAAIR